MSQTKKPKRNPLSKRDQEIGARLRKARESLRFTQEEFAAQVGITRQRLASYEEKRARLRYDLGLRICRQFIISEKWLATGKGQMRQCLDLAAEPVPHSSPIDVSLSDAFEQFLGERYEVIRKRQGDNVRLSVREGDNFEYMENLLLFCLSMWIKELPGKHGFPREFASAICAFLLRQGFGYIDFFIATGQLPGKDMTAFNEFLMKGTPRIVEGQEPP